MAYPTAQGSANCPDCGHPNKALSGPGVALLLDETDARGLEAFLNHELDDPSCEACNHSLGVRPTVLFVSTGTNASHFVLGSRAEAQTHREEILKWIRTSAARIDPGLVPEESPSLTALRDAVVLCLYRKQGKIDELLQARGQGNAAKYIIDNWRSLPADVFAAAYLACVVPQTKFQAPDGSEPSKLELLESFAYDQARTWCALWAAWASGGKHGSTLEEDLSRYIIKEALLPHAVETALQSLESVASNHELSVCADYSLEAVRASLCAASKQPNPKSGVWARRFFQAELAYATADSEGRSVAKPFLVSEERARATIPFEAAWNVVQPFLSPKWSDRQTLEALEKIAAKAGHPTLLGQVQSNMQIRTPKELSAENILARLRAAAVIATSSQEIVQVTRIVTRPLLEQGRVEDLEKIATGLVEILGGSYEAIARIDAWLSSCYGTLRMPQRLLDRIGEMPRDWEHSLSAYARAMLWTERSNALRALGRPEDALAAIEEVLRVFPSDGSESDRRVAERNRAILLRETGALDYALEALKSLLPQTSGEEQINTLESLAITYSEVGQYEHMLQCYEEALGVARGPFADIAPRLRAARALALTATDRSGQAISVLTELGDELEPQALFATASAWSNLVANQAELPEKAAACVTSVRQQLWALFENSERNGDVKNLINALRLYADLTEAAQLEGAEEFWQWVYAACWQYQQYPQALELLPLARYAYQRGDIDQGRHYLLQLPDALAFATGATNDLWMASLGQVRRLKGPLDELTRTIWEKGESFDDIRLIAELRRDVIGRARSLRLRPSASALATIRNGLTEEVVASLAPETGRVAVLEWVDTRDWIACFVTLIDADGRVSSHWLERPDVRIAQLAVTMQSRLATWRPRRAGDPFDLLEWQEFEKWLNASLSRYLEEDSHVVFIEHEDHAGLPWHVAARRWSTSYAAGWTALLALGSVAPDPRPARLGVVLVPRHYESPEVLQVLRSSAERTRKFAASLGLDFLKEDEWACDRDAFRCIMTGSTVAKLLCHGFIDPEEREVALMLAHNGSLPLALSVACNSPAGRAHRLSWRECQDLPAAPRVVFSAACSTGTSYLVGLGERLGLFAGLRHAGIRTIVAPHWDLFPQAVLPILDDTLERYVAGGITVAKALHSACQAAESRCPRWLAWTLMVEGDWR